MNMQNLMAQAQKMQRELTQKKNDFNKKEFVEEYEFIRIIATGDKKIKKIELTEESFKTKEDVEMLEDLLCIAMNNLMSKIDIAFEKEMGQYGSSLNGLI